MKVRPQPGYALLQILREDFKSSKRGVIDIPMDGKSTAFFNRMRIIALCPTTSISMETATAKKSPLDHRITLKKGDIVVISAAGAQIAVPGVITNEKERLVDVLLVPQGQIIAKLEGDIGEDIEPESNIITPATAPPGVH